MSETFEKVADVGVVRVNDRHAYAVTLIEQAQVLRGRRRRFIEIRVLDSGQATAWHFRVDPSAIPQLIAMLDRGERMSREIR